MDNLGDILRRLAATRSISNGEPPRELTEEPSEAGCGLCGGRGWLTPDVPAGHPEFGRFTPCQCQEERLGEERSARLLRYSNLGHLTRFTFETLDPEGRSPEPSDRALFEDAYRTAQRFAESPEHWLVFTGPNGSGKTHLAAAIANRCIERGHSVFFVHVPDLMDHLRSSFSPQSEVSYSDLFEQVRNTPLLILDGLESHGASSWAEEKLQQIVNHRYNALLPTVVTTASELNALDPYIRSRLEARDVSRVFEVRKRDATPTHRLGRIELEMVSRLTFETFDVRGNNPTAGQRASLEGAYTAARNFAVDPHGWLTLAGDTGVGKTHLAVAIAVKRMEGGLPVFFAFVPELLDYLRHTYSPDSRVDYDSLLEEIKNTPLLILDDLGNERSSPWAVEKLYQIVVHRHNARLPTVVTTMVDFTREREPIGSRVQDPSVGQLINIDAPDYRNRSKGRSRDRTRPAETRKRARGG